MFPESQQHVEEPPFTDCPEDHSDVPVRLLINNITGQSQDGFSIAIDGALERISPAESEGVEKNQVEHEGHSKRVMQASVAFGGP
jgi:hypothetical protein